LLEAEKFKSKGANRIFYMALPPSVFVATAGEIKAQCKTSSGWNRVIVEKPFGKDTESSAQLNKALGALFNEGTHLVIYAPLIIVIIYRTGFI
jgi:glucose-6-phosphate 1-dehydrogenase